MLKRCGILAFVVLCALVPAAAQAQTPHWTLEPEAAQLPTTNPAAMTVVQGTNFPVSSFKYDASTDESAYWTFFAYDYASGNVTARVYWYADNASSGDVIWGAQLSCITPNTDSQDVETDGLATANTATDTHLGTTGQRLHEIDITISNLDSLAQGDVCVIRIYRDADAGGDTMSNDAHLRKVVLLWTGS